MAKYKVVPVEITDEMAEASGCDGCFRKSVHDQAQDMWTAMLNVSPDVKREPVAYAVFADNGNIQIWSSDPAQVQALKHEFVDRVEPLIHLSCYEAIQAECDQLRKDAERIDWLADPENNIGNVQLPTVCVEQNLHSLREAIDAAMLELKQCSLSS